MAHRGGGPAPALAPVFVDVRAGPTGARLFVGDRESALPRLSADVLARLRQATPSASDARLVADARVFIRAEPDVRYADVVAPIDAMKRARFEAVTVIVPGDDAG